MLTRREADDDGPAITRVHRQAFQVADESTEPVEPALVAALRRSPEWLPRLSFVAVVGGEVVGHVVCSRAWVGGQRAAALGLGPMGVLPDHQGQGVGSALLHAVLGAADACDEPLVVLVGDPAYYGRFGFVPASDLGIEAPDPSWGDAFQARPLSSYTPDLHGPFRYAPPFGVG